jgi:hypothetical protein
MISDRHLSMLSELLLRKLNSELGDEEFTLLKDWLARETEARQYYVEFMALNAQLRKQRTAAVVSDPMNFDFSEAGPSDREAFVGLPGKADQDKAESIKPSPEQVQEIRRTAEERLQAFLTEQERRRQEMALYQRYQGTSPLMESLYDVTKRIYSISIWILRNTARLAILASVILLGLVITQYALRHRVVATLDEVVHAQWDQPPADANLHPGLMHLKEGFVSLTFKQGAEIILQAPCVFDLTSKNKMKLHQGIVTAQVPAQAHGFVIKTPQSTITDFGTEFGVKVQSSTASEIHVFDGRVQMKTTKRPHQQVQIRNVTRGRAAVLTNSGELNICDLNTRFNLFVRDIPDAASFGIPNKRLDLADIVGGGNGFGTGSRYAGINPITGQTISIYRSERRTGGSRYVEVPSLPFVDGVFVPLAEGGLMPVSTSGHHFDFPSGGDSWFVEPANAGEAKYRDLPHELLILAGQNYGTVTHPALLMHANLGITFDLNAIRESLTRSRIKRFTSVCGINNHVKRTKTPDAIFYVLIDGQARFFRKIALPTDLAVDIDIDLQPHERFLTLACLAGTKNLGDWSLFGDPALELESMEE